MRIIIYCRDYEGYSQKLIKRVLSDFFSEDFLLDCYLGHMSFLNSSFINCSFLFENIMRKK